MKQNKVTLYAKVLAQILSQKGIDSASSADREKKIVKNFVALLINSGYAHKATEILDLTQDLLLKQQGRRKITFETARVVTKGQRKMMDAMVEKGDVVLEKINPQLIAGVKIIINNETQFDNSLLAKLNNF